MAGNAVVLKHSAQTPVVRGTFRRSFREAGLPEGVFQVLHLSHENTERVAKDPRVAFIAFTGSVAGGHAIQRAIAGSLHWRRSRAGGMRSRLRRHDANLAHAIENLVDGAFFNSGQSCCGIQRIYVHEKVHDAFVDGAIALTRQYVLGNPTEQATTLGPVVRTSAADQVRGRSRRASMLARNQRSTRRCLPRAARALRTLRLSCC